MSLSASLLFRRVFLSGLFLATLPALAQTWRAPQAITGLGSFNLENDDYPRIATDGEGVWIAVWHTEESVSDVRQSGTNVVFSRLTDAGATWSAPGLLSSLAAENPGPDSNPSVVSWGGGAGLRSGYWATT